jgi:hypothetical protein
MYMSFHNYRPSGAKDDLFLPRAMPAALLNPYLRRTSPLRANASHRGDWSDRGRADQSARPRFGRFLGRHHMSTTLCPDRARTIMGKNYFGFEEAIRHFGVNPSRQQLTALSEIPFSEAVLESCKDTHVLVAVFPVSILEIRSKVNAKLVCYQDWYNGESFAKECNDASWRLVRKTPVDNSTSKNWREQRALISKDEEIPTAQAMVYTIIGHLLATDERLFEDVRVRTASVSLNDRRVNVGFFDPERLGVYDFWDDCRNDDLGVASGLLRHNR